jgi:hypothetical protein
MAGQDDAREPATNRAKSPFMDADVMRCPSYANGLGANAEAET